jgi:hypothetical protein
MASGGLPITLEDIFSELLLKEVASLRWMQQLSKLPMLMAVQQIIPILLTVAAESLPLKKSKGGKV